MLPLYDADSLKPEAGEICSDPISFQGSFAICLDSSSYLAGDEYAQDELHNNIHLKDAVAHK